LARAVLGELQVQGMDYAYTLQGWLKGVNSTSLNPLQDVGGDGIAENSVVARDVMGFALHYYDDANNAFDYKPIVTNANGPSFARPSSGIGFAGKSLFNGNIAGITMNNGGLANGANGTVNASPLFYMYGYDQLNRLVNMQAYTGLVTTGNANTWPATPQATNDYKEQVSYDPNGNIVSYNRNGATGITPPSGFTGGQAMDQLSYRYYYYDINNNKLPYNPTLGVPTGGRGTNQLSSVGDQVPSTNYADDIDDQVNTDNYGYDEIGNLVIDKAEGLYNPTIASPAGTAIEWTVYGKIAKITKIKAGTTTVITYRYDVSGKRISKQVTQSGATTGDKTTVYVRDASGNVMSIYEAGDPTINNSSLTQTEVHLYGSSRLGLMNVNVNVQIPVGNTTGITIFERANKVFELTNHLGNVLATVSDRTVQVQSTIDITKAGYFLADVITANDYYPGGMQMPGRKYQAGSSSYRYGFNGQEKSTEINDALTTAQFWEYDSRIGKRWNVDPILKVGESPYLCFSGNPIIYSDLLGDDPVKPLSWAKQLWYFATNQSYLVRLNAFAVANKIDDSQISCFQYSLPLKIGSGGITSFAIITEQKYDENTQTYTEYKHVFREIRKGILPRFGSANDDVYQTVNNSFDDNGNIIPNEDDESNGVVGSLGGGGFGNIGKAQKLIAGASVVLNGVSKGSKAWTIYSFLTQIPKSGTYFGLTVDFARRMAQHGVRILGTPSKLIENIPNKLTARGIEQLFINFGRKTGIITEQINSLSPKNKAIYDKGLKMAEEFIQKNYGDKFDFLFKK